jgi:hypothetical protein
MSGVPVVLLFLPPAAAAVAVAPRVRCAELLPWSWPVVVVAVVAAMIARMVASVVPAAEPLPMTVAMGPFLPARPVQAVREDQKHPASAAPAVLVSTPAALAVVVAAAWLAVVAVVVPTVTPAVVAVVVGMAPVAAPAGATPAMGR